MSCPCAWRQDMKGRDTWSPRMVECVMMLCAAPTRPPHNHWTPSSHPLCSILSMGTFHLSTHAFLQSHIKPCICILTISKNMRLSITCVSCSLVLARRQKGSGDPATSLGNISFDNHLKIIYIYIYIIVLTFNGFWLQLFLSEILLAVPQAFECRLFQVNSKTQSLSYFFDQTNKNLQLFKYSRFLSTNPL